MNETYAETKFGDDNPGDVEPDDLRLTLESYLRLPDSFDLRIEGEEVRLLTTDFPALLQEAMDFSFLQFFTDFWATIPNLSAVEKERLTNEFTNLFKTTQGFYSRPEGALLNRVSKDTIALPKSLTNGVVESITVSEQVKFRLEAAPPDQARFEACEGITFRCFGQDIAIRTLSLKAENGTCEIIPELEVVALEKAANLMESLKNKLASGILKIKKLCLKAPVVQEEFRQYLKDGLNLKVALREHKQDLLSLFDRLSEIKIEDPFPRAVFRGAKRYRRSREKIELNREKDTVCDLGGMNLALAPNISLCLRRKTDQLQIDDVNGLGLQIPFDPPAQLETLGLKLSRTIPNEISSLTLGLLTKSKRRKVVVGIGTNRWISCLINREMEPVFDQYGHWTLSGVVTNPISNNGQSFYLRLDRKFQIDMSVAELMSLFTETALEGFDPINPITWHWGIAALGSGAISSMGEGLLKERTLSELKDGAAGAIKKGADAAKAKASAGASAAKAGAQAGVDAAKKGANAAAKTASEAASKLKNGAKAAADLFKKKSD